MGRYIVKFPRDRYLKHHKLNDVSSWRHIREEWVGAREKFIASPVNSGQRYMVKFPNYGLNEIRIELFNCCLGMNLGIEVAYYFPCIYRDIKEQKGIITKNFLSSGSQLREMKELICHHSNRPNLKEKFGRHPEVLKEHNIDTIYLILEAEYGEKVLHGFFRMVGFDCLIGHGDRHWKNYGVIITDNRGNLEYRFAPVYDTASGYFLEMPDEKLREMIGEGKLNDENWYKPKKHRGLCKIICNDNIKTNHVELFEYILDNPNFSDYAPSLIDPVRRFDMKLVRYLLKNSFYLKNLSNDRKFAIKKVLEMRKKILDSIIRDKYKGKYHA